MGELEHGSYTDECSGMNEHEINSFYGFDINGKPVEVSDSSKPHELLSEEEDDSDQDTRSFSDEEDEHDVIMSLENSEGTVSSLLAEMGSDAAGLPINVETVSIITHDVYT